MRAAAITSVLVALLAATGCTAAQTALVIRIDSDLARGTELESVRVQVVREIDGASLLDGSYDLTQPRFPLPGTVVINAASAIDARPMRVAVVGNVRGAAAIERQFVVRFRPGRVVLLDAFLARRCAPPSAVVCDDRSSCGPCNCDPIEPGALPDYDPAGTNPSPNSCGEPRDGGPPLDVPAICTPTPEVCNGVDDDCDRLIDEDLRVAECGVGACHTTVYPCRGGEPVTCTPGTPTREVCNGVDDDCNGAPDDRACQAFGPDQSCLAVRSIVGGQMRWACCSRVASELACQRTQCTYCVLPRMPTDPYGCCFDPR